MPLSLEYDYHYNSFKSVMYFFNINVIIHLSPFLVTCDDHGNYAQFWTCSTFFICISENTLWNYSYDGPPYYALLHPLFYKLLLDFFRKPSLILNYNSAAVWFSYATLYAQCSFICLSMYRTENCNSGNMVVTYIRIWFPSSVINMDLHVWTVVRPWVCCI